MKKWYQKPPALLLLLLLASSLLMAGLGLVLKHTVGSGNEQIEKTLAIVVPFVLLRGDVSLEREEQDLPTLSLPESEQPGAQEGDDGGEQPPGGALDTEDEDAKPPAEEEPPEALFGPVEESYFDSVLFIGDSRTVGLASYARLGQADYFCDVGMSMFNLFDKTISDKNFAGQSLKGLFSWKQYNTIYLSLGINEIGYPTASLEKKLAAVVAELRALQPQAKLVLQANLMVTQQKAAGNPSFALEKLQGLNAMIAAHADNVDIFYLDPNPYFADESGYLRAEVTGDGVHPYAKEYKNWSLWIQEHALLRK